MTLATLLLDELLKVDELEEPELGIAIQLKDGSEVVLTFTPEGPITVTSGCPGDIWSAATNLVNRVKDSNLISHDQGEGEALFIILFDDHSVLGIEFLSEGLQFKTGYGLVISGDNPLTSN